MSETNVFVCMYVGIKCWDIADLPDWTDLFLKDSLVFNINIYNLLFGNNRFLFFCKCGKMLSFVVYLEQATFNNLFFWIYYSDFKFSIMRRSMSCYNSSDNTSSNEKCTIVYIALNFLYDSFFYWWPICGPKCLFWSCWKNYIQLWEQMYCQFWNYWYWNRGIWLFQFK